MCGGERGSVRVRGLHRETGPAGGMVGGGEKRGAHQMHTHSATLTMSTPRAAVQGDGSMNSSGKLRAADRVYKLIRLPRSLSWLQTRSRQLLGRPGWRG